MKMTAQELLAAYAAGRRDFTGANLSGADLIGADLRGADLRGAKLIGADFRDAKYVSPDWSAAIAKARVIV